MSIEALLYTALDAQTSAGSRVSVGLRLQSAALPALVISVQGSERAALGASGSVSLVRYTYAINAVAETMADALTLAGTAAGVVQSEFALTNYSTYRIQEPQLADASPGEGDEQMPAIASVILETLLPE